MTQLLLTGSDSKSTGISIALIVLDLFFVAALLGSSALLVIRRQKGVNWRILPVWAIMAAIWAWAWYYIWYVVEGITDRLTAPVEAVGINSIYGLLSLLFAHAAVCFLFCTFYRLTHILLKASNDGGKLPAKINVIHWVTLTLIVAITIADFVLWAIVYFSFLVLEGNYRPVQITRSVLVWLASWEITAWALFLAIKAKRTSILKGPAISLLCGSTAFSVMTFMWIVDFLRWYQPVETYTSHEETNSMAARSFLEIFFCVGVYGGIMAFCILSYQLEEKDDTGMDLPRMLAQDTRPWIQEADSRGVMEAEASVPVVEAEASAPVVEADGSRPIFEADSNPRHNLDPERQSFIEKKSSTYY